MTLESIEQFAKGKKLTHEIAYICDEDGCEIKDIN